MGVTGTRKGEFDQQVRVLTRGAVGRRRRRRSSGDDEYVDLLITLMRRPPAS